MKFPYILLCVFAWLTTIAIAYTLGMRMTTQQWAGTEIAIPAKIKSPAAVPQGVSVVNVNAQEPEQIEDFEKSTDYDLYEAIENIESLSEADTLDFLDEAIALPETNYRRARTIRELLGQLAKTSPEQAMALSADIGAPRDVEQARVVILRAWAEQDPAAALTWAEDNLQNQSGRSKYNQLMALFEGYTKADPQSAFADALELPSDNNNLLRIRSGLLQQVVRLQIQDGGLEDAKQQIESIESAQTRDRLLETLIDEWAEFDPASAATYIESLGDESPSRAINTLLNEWAHRDPKSAATWLSNQEVSTTLFSSGSSSIIRQWTRYDLEGPAEWLNSQPKSQNIDRAIMSYTYQASRQDAATAMSWAQSIDNATLRDRAMRQVAGNWKENDPEAFQEYIDSAELSAKQKERLKNANVSNYVRWAR